jgi:hypothetical protein
MQQPAGSGLGKRGSRLLAVCLFGIGVVPAFAREGKTPRIFPSRRDAYVLSRTGGNSSMNVSVEDLKALRSRFSEDFLWFRRNGKEYVISDPAVIDEAERCFDPLRPLRRQQEALGDRDRVLDREEEALDRKHDALVDADHDTREARLDERRRDVETRLRAIREQQRDLEREERILDEREEALEKVAEARLDRLIDDALRRDLARPLTGR